MPKYVLAAMPPQIPAEVIALLERAKTATIGHWRHWGFVDRGIAPILRRRRSAGTAVTVQIPGPDFDAPASRRRSAPARRRAGSGSTWRHATRLLGGVVTAAAKAAGAKAAVIDGPCTDREEIEAFDFPIWCRGVAPLTTRPYDLGGRPNVPVSIGGAVVMPGDAGDGGEEERGASAGSRVPASLPLRSTGPTTGRTAPRAPS